MPRKTNNIISIQSVPPDLWESVKRFLEDHKMMGKSDLGRKAIENYIQLANKYGIDANWDLKLPDNASRK